MMTQISGKLLSIAEPYASFIRAELKRIETRSRYTAYRGTVIIHASKNLDWFASAPADLVEKLPRTYYGEAIAIAEIVDCKPITSDFAATLPETELRAGIYTPGRYAWILDNIRPIDPVAMRGCPFMIDTVIDIPA